MSNITPYEQRSAAVSIFTSESAFEYAQRMAKMLSKSDLVPAQFREGDKGIANTLIALEFANRMGASPLMVMQNLDIIEGRPAFRAKFLAALLLNSGYSITYETENLGKQKIQVVTWTGPKGAREKKEVTREIENIRCRVVAEYKGKTLTGSWVSMEMANKEGWIDKPGSKWLTMPEQMIAYRAVSFFASVHAPDLFLLIGRTREEVEDMVQLRDVDADYEELVVEAKLKGIAPKPIDLAAAEILPENQPDPEPTPNTTGDDDMI